MGTVSSFTIPDRGVCSVCGKPAWDGRATKCEEHRSKKGGKGPSTVKTDVVDEPMTINRAPSPPPPADPNGAKKDRARVLKASILNDLNPQMVQGFAIACQPVPRENFLSTLPDGKLQITPLGQQVMLADWQADIIGKAAAELESSPIAQSAKVVVGPLLPIIYGVGAVGVLVMHGVKLMQTRDQLIALYREQTGQAEAQNADNPAQSSTQEPAPEPAPEPTPGYPDFSDMSVA